MNKEYDAIVIGAGHAGIEAAYALAKLGKNTLLTSMSLDSIGFMACNPNVGGSAKGHLVKEIDALGGLMGEIADLATIQIRMLNLSNGPAVHSLRAQVDKNLYHRKMKERLENTENLTILQSEVANIIIDANIACGVITAMGDKYKANVVILATGVYLNAKIITGEYSKLSGPNGFYRSEILGNNLKSIGLPIRRFKTGTPPRVMGSTVDFAKMTVQNGDNDRLSFSIITDFDVRNDMLCYLTYTNEDTHKIILSNLDKAPLYNGAIEGTGPRYCPSIEDKVVRFKDKSRHQLFIEPEGAETNEMYVQGLSTSLPYYIQEEILATIPGLENAKITRYGYAIEYDCIDPQALLPTLETKTVKGLFCCGQINGSSGYEEAAAQGLIAGINACQYVDKKEPFVLKRDEAYIGVLIDDLVTNGTNEPYRMMTSRAEYRLSLRQDNVYFRLSDLGKKTGLTDSFRYEKYLQKKSEIEALEKVAITKINPSCITELFKECNENLPKNSISIKDLFKRPGINAQALSKYIPELSKFAPDVLHHYEVETKYEGYLSRQTRDVKAMEKMENYLLPPEIDYLSLHGLRIEARQKLEKVRPRTLAQASRISGVTPADINVLIVFLKRK
ncbi:MAG: tRNA uridine-5-carboxymethylaminomethyl(34) synthesis enzyme MnmG [Christensenellaceae bacterium]|nr:tRNA uridine-5-carboxymethylaminomethyl(34) synthesis enzyme MnmG [Christensenellaceae bacterium]